MKPNSIEIFEKNDRCVVRIVEAGEAIEKEFQLAIHAQSWAAGQSTRLNLPENAFVRHANHIDDK